MEKWWGLLRDIANQMLSTPQGRWRTHLRSPDRYTSRTWTSQTCGRTFGYVTCWLVTCADMPAIPIIHYWSITCNIVNGRIVACTHACVHVRVHACTQAQAANKLGRRGVHVHACMCVRVCALSRLRRLKQPRSREWGVCACVHVSTYASSSNQQAGKAGVYVYVCMRERIFFL